MVVRAMAPVAAKPPKKGATMLESPLGDQLLVGVVAVVNLAVRRRAEKKRLDGASRAMVMAGKWLAEIVNGQLG